MQNDGLIPRSAAQRQKAPPKYIYHSTANRMCERIIGCEARNRSMDTSGDGGEGGSPYKTSGDVKYM